MLDTENENQKEIISIYSVLEFLKWVEDLNRTEVLFRGHGCCAWNVESTAKRLHENETSQSALSSIKNEILHNQNIINHSKKKSICGKSTSAIARTDWGILAQKQHNDEDVTSLLDFTSNPTGGIILCLPGMP